MASSIVPLISLGLARERFDLGDLIQTFIEYCFCEQGKTSLPPFDHWAWHELLYAISVKVRRNDLTLPFSISTFEWDSPHPYNPGLGDLMTGLCYTCDSRTGDGRMIIPRLKRGRTLSKAVSLAPILFSMASEIEGFFED